MDLRYLTSQNITKKNHGFISLRRISMSVIHNVANFSSLEYIFIPEQISKSEQKQVRRSLSGRPSDVSNSDKKAIKVEVPDIVSVSACADLTLPPGAGLCIDTIHGPLFLVSTISFSFFFEICLYNQMILTCFQCSK